MTNLPFNPDNFLLIAADNWPSLRRCDVFRLFNECREENWPELFGRLVEKRPELQAAAESALSEIIKERHPAYVADQPLDPPGYALRVAVLEATGLPRGDAQGAAEAELMQGGAL